MANPVVAAIIGRMPSLELPDHREIEHGDWEVFIHAGRAWFTPPTWIDPQQTPILNPMHHPPPRE